MAAAAAGGAVAAGGVVEDVQRCWPRGRANVTVCRVGVVLLCVWRVQGGGRWEGGQACGVVAFRIPKPRDKNELARTSIIVKF